VPVDQNPIPIDASPADRIAAAVAVYGEYEVVQRASALLAGANAGDDFLLYVGGEHAQGILHGAPALYWPELWGARALMYVWNATANIAIQSGLTNQAWRVREMCAKVALHRELPLGESLAPLLTDDVGRVRIAAARALAEVGDFEHGAAIKRLLKDPDHEVRHPAGEALTRLSHRLDRKFD
jgi:HEAT repeat protein